MNDLISRQAAILELRIWWDDPEDNRSTSQVMDSLPTIDPVKHGKWMWQDSPVFGNPYGSYMCPLCQNTMPHKTNYCPNCGAKMEDSEE